ncbi:hypothetical protein Y032_0064g3516 [Ancylostoma ceylanicum]|uniref:Reduced folate carrier n=1 Tax=Ancylostoma ceylanicum TaxID=53326 RepID=A0A016U181_9BILA|nr:hypothetical protein Y032_0064g3516 [Ancylostoma ceylanicum]
MRTSAAVRPHSAESTREHSQTTIARRVQQTVRVPRRAAALVRAILAFTIQFAAIDWIKYGELTLTVSSCLIAVILAVISQTNHVVLAYVGYVCITSIYHTLITAASCNIAIELTSTNYGLVFGWNTFVAVLLQTLLTLVVADSHGLNLDMRTQFVVYSMYFAAVGALFLVVSVWSRCKKSSANDRADVAQDSE